MRLFRVVSFLLFFTCGIHPTSGHGRFSRLFRMCEFWLGDKVDPGNDLRQNPPRAAIVFFPTFSRKLKNPDTPRTLRWLRARSLDGSGFVVRSVVLFEVFMGRVFRARWKNEI